MKRAFIAALIAVTLPAHAQDMAALAPAPQNGQSIAGEEIPMASVMPVVQKPVHVKAAHNLRTGTVLHSSDLIIEGDNQRAQDLFVGMELKRAIYAGAKISPKDVGPPTAIQRNALVTLEFKRGPLMITTEGRALAAGAVGDTVRVMNLNSKVILTAVVSGPNKAVTK